MNNFKDHLIPSGTTTKNALIQLNVLGKDAILFVVDEQNRLIGSLTDGDVRRALIKDTPIDTVVDKIIQPSPKYIRKGDRNIEQVVDLRTNLFRIIPVLNERDQVVNVINFRELRSYLPVDAVIMAGGKGTRLMPLTKDTPKPLIKVAEKPILEHNLDRLVLYGIDDFWITINYLGEQIVDYFGDGTSRNIRIDYVREPKALGTIGSVSLIENFEHEYILLTNSDLLTNLDYEHFFLEFLKSDADLSVVTIPYHVNVPYAVMETSNGHVVSFKEKPTYTYYSNGGIYLIKRKALELLPKGGFYNATDLMEALIENGGRVVSYPLMGYWLDIGKHEDYQKAQEDFNNIKF